MANRLRSDISVTPLVDIVLVLLIVFITLVPAIPRSLATALPMGAGRGGVRGTVPWTRISQALDGDLRLEEVAIRPGELSGRLRGAHGRVPLRIHPDLPFQQVTSVLDAVKGARPEAQLSLIVTRDL